MIIISNKIFMALYCCLKYVLSAMIIFTNNSKNVSLH